MDIKCCDGKDKIIITPRSPVRVSDVAWIGTFFFFHPEKDHTLCRLSLIAMGQGTFVFPSVNSTPPDDYVEI